LVQRLETLATFFSAQETGHHAFPFLAYQMLFSILHENG